MFELAPFGRGFGLGFSLIAAIGAQNAYVLTRGILHNHHFVVALVCSVLDALLITAGVVGMGKLVQAYPSLITVMTVFGALFLFFLWSAVVPAGVSITITANRSKNSFVESGGCYYSSDQLAESPSLS